MQPRFRTAQSQDLQTHPLQRIRWWYGILLFVGAVIVVRLFYLQVIRHDYYQKSAFKSQLKQYEIPAERGSISARNGDQTVPLVLNETLYTLFADPKYIKEHHSYADQIQKIIGGDANKYEQLLKTPDTRYVVLAKKLTREQNDQIEKLKLKGIGTREAQYRTYPDGQLAAQVLGFVNEDNEGKYGIEQALDAELKGAPGRLKAITDAQGVPLPANKDNLVESPQAGKKIVLTLDIGIQQQVEDILKAGVEGTKAKNGSATVIDVKTGAIRAMASYPTYNPSEYYKVEDGNAFNNNAVAAPLEVGSVMKALTTAAALDAGVVTPATTYYDPSFYKIDDATIRNVEEDGGAGQKSVRDILGLSLNTGATWLLMQMGGGEINAKARLTWNDYMVNRYQLGKQTGIEQGFEAEGYIPDPRNGQGLNLTYANSAFGQGMTATPLQMGAAFSAVVNGGTYYKPHLIEKEIDGNGKETVIRPEVVRSGVVKPEVSQEIQDMLEYTLYSNRFVYGASLVPTTYGIGGKTGTAQISKPEGGYYDDRFNGTYLGFVGGNDPQYVIVVEVTEPHVVGYAGAKAAAPIFLKVANMLINSYDVDPKH
jgi:stage V sporulation protein D (sporulation-specific penicillin-binding protein)